MSTTALKLSFSLLAALLLAPLPLSAQFFTDNFDDNSIDTGLWTINNIGSGDKLLQEANQRLEAVSINGSGVVGLTYQGRIYFDQSWVLSFDTYLDSTITGTVENQQATVEVFSNFTAGSDFYGLNFGVWNDLWVGNQRVRDPFFNVFTPAGDVQGSVFSDQNLHGIRMSYDAATGALSFDYNLNGTSNPNTWQPIPITQGDAANLVLTPNPGDYFEFDLGLTQGGQAIASGQQYADNFSIVPEPTTGALLLSALALAAYRRKRS